MLSVADAYQDPHLRTRGFFETVTHPETGTHDYPGMMWHMSYTLGRIRTPACCLGAHNDDVYSNILGYSAEEIETFKQAGHIGDSYR